jgi:hypothetical protein
MPADEVGEALVAAWDSPARRHVEGPLATVTALVVGADAVPAMRSYVLRLDGREDDGTAAYVSAAIAHLGGTAPSDPDPEMVAWFEESLSIAADLRSDFLRRRRKRCGLAVRL